MVQALVDRPGVDVELAHVEEERGAVRDALRLDLAGLVARDGGGIGQRRRREALAEGQGARELLVGEIGAEIEAGLDVGGDPVADIDVEVLRGLRLVGTEPVGIGQRRVDQHVERPVDAGHLGLFADRAEAAAIDPQDVGRQRRVGRGRHDVDGAAQGRCPEGEGVAALVDLHRAQGERIDLIEVAAPVREVERDPVLQQLDAAQVKGAGDAGAADRQAQLLPVALLHVDARHVLEHVAKRVGVAVLERRGVDEGYGPDGSREGGPLAVDARHRERAAGLARRRVRRGGADDAEFGQGDRGGR